jgi:hypothetical protein
MMAKHLQPDETRALPALPALPLERTTAPDGGHDIDAIDDQSLFDVPGWTRKGRTWYAPGAEDLTTPFD